MKVLEEVWLNGKGERIDSPELAVTGEIHWLDDDGNPQRTYVDHRPFNEDKGDVLNDREAPPWHGPELWDSTGKTWDLYSLGNDRLVETLEDYLTALGLNDAPLAAQRTDVCIQLQLPSWNAAPQRLQDEVYAWLVATKS